jgi:hypothetical protein
MLDAPHREGKLSRDTATAKKAARLAATVRSAARRLRLPDSNGIFRVQDLHV